jgi:hypothetical protein
MRTIYEPLSSKYKAELSGYVSWAVRLVRAILFIAVVLLVTASLKSIHSSFAPKEGLGGNRLFWIIPALAFVVWFHSAWQRWTGGARGTADIRKDLARGEVAIHHVQVLDAIEIEEVEDEGPSYFILTDEKEVLYFSGQWLDREKRKGFPWTTFNILEAPASRTFFSLKKTGERFRPSHIRKALDWETLKKFGAFKGSYRILNVDFESLKSDPVQSSSAATVTKR